MAEEQSQWVGATTQHRRVSRLPERYRQELNAAAIVSILLTGLATKNYYGVKKKMKIMKEKPNWPVMVQVW